MKDMSLSSRFRQKILCASCGAGSGGKTALEEVATSGGVPIDHFSGAEEAGLLLEHEMVVEFAPSNAACGGDGFFDGAWAAQREREGVGD